MRYARSESASSRFLNERAGSATATWCAKPARSSRGMPMLTESISQATEHARMIMNGVRSRASRLKILQAFYCGAH